MKKLFFLMTILTVAFISCTPEQKAKATVKDFLSQYVADDYSIGRFGRMDSTRYVTDSTIMVLRQSAKKTGLLAKDIAYAQPRRSKNGLLTYLPVSIKIYDREENLTFYLTPDLQEVVAVK